LSDRLNVTVLFRFPTDTLPILKDLTQKQPKEIILPKKMLKVSKSPLESYNVYAILAIDPTNSGLNYYLDSVEESELRSARQASQISDGPLKVNTQGLFDVNVDEGIVRAVKPQSFYNAAFYKLKLRVTLKDNPEMSSSGHLIIKVDSTKESLFSVQVFEIDVDENQKTIMHVFGKL